jgi:hypothetical protein
VIQHVRRNAVGYVALFVALGGTSYAAAQLPRNSVGTAQIRANAITSSKVRNGSLLPQDFKTGKLPAGPTGAQGTTGAQGPAGPAGPQGTKGDTGAAGSALAYAHILVTAGGATVDSQRSKGVAQSNVSHPGTGIVCLKGLAFTPHNASANGDAVENPSVVVSVGLAPDAEVLAACGGDGQIALAMQTVGSSTANLDHSIYLTIN